METKELAPWNWFKRGNLSTKRGGESLWSEIDEDVHKSFEDYFSNFNLNAVLPDDCDENHVDDLFKNSISTIKIAKKTKSTNPVKGDI